MSLQNSWFPWDLQAAAQIWLDRFQLHCSMERWKDGPVPHRKYREDPRTSCRTPWTSGLAPNTDGKTLRLLRNEKMYLG